MASVRVRKLEVGWAENNCYILTCPETMESIVIDPAAEADKILGECKGVRVKYILITHGHQDHVGALSEVKDSTGGLIGIHPEDASRIPMEPDLLLEDHSFLTFGNLELKVLHTPGHTPGGTCFLIEEYLFSGDTIFPGGPGNTSLPGANHSDILKSIWEKVFVLPDSTIIYPGHGLETTVGKEKDNGIYGSGRS